MVSLNSCLVSANFGTCSYQCSFSNFIHNSLLILKCGWADILFTTHVAVYNVHYLFPYPSHSLFYFCISRYIKGLVALTMSGWSTFSCLVAVNFLSSTSTRFRLTVDSKITIIIVIIFLFILIYASSMFHLSYGLNYLANLCFNTNHRSNFCWMLLLCSFYVFV
jgi:hypothetical protein